MKTIQRKYLKCLASQLLPNVKESLPETQWEQVFDLLDSIVTEDASTENIVRRWRGCMKRPLRHQLHRKLNRGKWRAGRSTGDAKSPEKLRPPAQVRFGAAESSNFTIVEEEEVGGVAVREPVTRGEFFERGLAALEHVVKARGLAAGAETFNSTEAWAQLARDLDAPSAMNDWPIGAPPPREFVRQLIKDLYFAALGLRDGWPQAYAVKIGALRRPGNVFDAQAVENATAALDALLDS
jgi:hypothetical protein